MIHRRSVVVMLALMLCSEMGEAATNPWDKGSPSQGAKNSGLVLSSGKATADAGWTLQREATLYAWEALKNGALEKSVPVKVDTKTGAWKAAFTLTPGRTYYLYVSVPQVNGCDTQYIATPIAKIQAP